jgi:transposase
MDSPCPWGPGNHDLRKRKLLLTEKSWLANKYIHGELSAREIQQRFKVCNSLLRKYVERTVRGEKLYSKSGQPRKLDDISLTFLLNLFQSDPNIDETLFRTRIREQYRESLRRRFPGEPEYLLRRRKALSRHSVYSYSRQIKSAALHQSSQQHPPELIIGENTESDRACILM